MRLLFDDGSWIFDDFTELEWLFMEWLPRAARGEEMNAEARSRLLPDPLDVGATERERQKEFLEDWREIVQSDLYDGFESQRQLVETDLAQVRSRKNGEGDRRYSLRIDSDHVEAWYSTLNQARLLLHEAHRIADLDRDPDRLDEEDNETLLLLSQYTFYLQIQSFLVEYLMKP